MLLQNPQLAYALLQAQVVMKIVDPVIAQVGVWNHKKKKYKLHIANHISFSTLFLSQMHSIFMKMTQ